MAARTAGVEVSMPPRREAEVEEPERRMAEDGVYYTQSEFRDCYGSDAEWESRAEVGFAGFEGFIHEDLGGHYSTEVMPLGAAKARCIENRSLAGFCYDTAGGAIPEDGELIVHFKTRFELTPAPSSGWWAWKVGWPLLPAPAPSTEGQPAAPAATAVEPAAAVDTPDRTAGVEAPLPPLPPQEPERRMAEDGVYYTQSEFRDCYGSDAEWESRAEVGFAGFEGFIREGLGGHHSTEVMSLGAAKARCIEDPSVAGFCYDTVGGTIPEDGELTVHFETSFELSPAPGSGWWAWKVGWPQLPAPTAQRAGPGQRKRLVRAFSGWPAQGAACPCALWADPAAGQGSGGSCPPLPEVARLSERVWRVLGRNPGSFTLTGTNIYLVGSGARRILIDTGEAKPGVLQNLCDVMRREECQAIDQIVITHWHHDHLTGLKEVLAGLGPVPVRMYLPTEGTARNGRNIYGELGGTFDPNEYLQDVEVVGLEDGEVLRCEGATLQVMHTPGHTNDHVCLALEEERALFTGDNVLGWGTGTFQDLQQYMRSLQKMRAARAELLYPAHGPVVGEGGAEAWIDMYISHREERTQQVVHVLREAQPSGLTLEEVSRQVYKDRPDVLGTPALFGGARNNTRLVLEYLQKEGQCSVDGSCYSLSVPSRL